MISMIINLIKISIFMINKAMKQEKINQRKKLDL